MREFLRFSAIVVGLTLFVGQTAAQQAQTPAATNNSDTTTTPSAPAAQPTPDTNGAAEPPSPGAAPPADPSAPDTEGGDDVSIGEIPNIETEELTPELAKKAIDGYVMIHEKYQDSPLEDYQDLQEFVDKDPKGKQFEIDLNSFGFRSVNDWNLAITSVSVAYNNILDDQTADTKQQIEDIKNSKDMAQDMKDRAIKSLQASIPSENNHKVVDDLMKDKDYGEKIKLLETSEE